MKIGILFLLLLEVCLSTPHALFDVDETTPMLRRSLQQSNITTRRRSKRECVVLLVHKQYEGNLRVDQPLECELQGEDLNGKKYKMVRVKGLTTKWALKNNVTSGVSTIFVPEGAIIDDLTNELVVPSGTVIKLGRRKKTRSMHSRMRMMDPSDLMWDRKLETGVRTVMVVRIVAKDSQTTATEAQLANDVFGAFGDVLNLKSGYDRCSYGQLQFEPLRTNAKVGSDGVYTVFIPNTAAKGKAPSVIAAAALDQVTNDLGVPPNFLADHVMFCIPPGSAGDLPPGSTGDWVAYANVNGWRSVYNDERCQHPSVQMHEIGHNLNLAHSSELTEEKGDWSGTMGPSYREDEGPKRCFNGANTWQLGWFPSFHVDLPIGNSFYWDGNLVGFAERDAASSASDRMIIRIRSTEDYYIHFNRQIGMNAGTAEGGDMVLVTKRAPGTGYAFSYLLAKLSAGGVYNIPNFNRSNVALSIIVRSIQTGTAPGRANISVRFGPSPAPVQPTTAPTTSPTRVPTTAPTQVPTTKSPTQAPTTKSPTQAPTTSPTQTPTTAPTQTPTTAPTQTPTEALTASPTEAPVPTTPAPIDPTPSPDSSPPVAVESSLAPDATTPSPVEPTLAPTTAPTTIPTQSPTTAPTTAPTTIPTQSPTTAPTASPLTGGNPTKAPTKAPTKFPTKTPTRARTKNPTKAPTKVTAKAPFCNKNGTCEPGENCVSCPADCRGGFSGNTISSPNCCIGGACASRCTTNTGWKCK